MTTFEQFASRTKMRHDWGDQIQVRYKHTNGENYDTWISGEEIMARLKTASREKLIKSFARLNMADSKKALNREIQKGRDKTKRRFRDKLADTVSDNIGGNLLGDTLADKVRGVDSDIHPYDREKQMWQKRLNDPAFRIVALDMAWFNLEDSLPESDTPPAEPDDWV